jgi:hypothetical protein
MYGRLILHELEETECWSEEWIHLVQDRHNYGEPCEYGNETSGCMRDGEFVM